MSIAITLVCVVCDLCACVQLLEEAEQRRRDREQRLFESLETQTPPSFQLKVSPHPHTLLTLTLTPLTLTPTLYSHMHSCHALTPPHCTDTLMLNYILCADPSHHTHPHTITLSQHTHHHTITHPHTITQDDDITFEGVLYRKNELDEGGRRAAARSWKQYHTVLIGPLLNFYRDKRDVQSYLSACPPINVTHGLCEVAGDYVKRKHTLRLK